MLPRPTVTSVSPASGGTAGKTAVTIKGEDLLLLLLVKSVSFGGVPAESFSEDSDTQATAVAPPGMRSALG
ncbi:MAG: IPT/TIG domain-containing protein [Thermoleophilia bacterium]|nr:IPT/TIG domain-containing protein [Thermoleophilia bacterium]